MWKVILFILFLDERAQNRRPIPVITSDWISTPRSQLSVLSGTYFLSGVEQLEIQRVIDLSTCKYKIRKSLTVKYLN